MKKKSTLYTLILLFWLACAALLACFTIRLIGNIRYNPAYSTAKKIAISVLLCFNSLLLAALWLGSVKDLSFSVAYAVMHKKLQKRYEAIPPVSAADFTAPPKFYLLYCTCNDFNAAALARSMAQRYPNFETVILDDSSKEEYLRAVDDFAAEHRVRVVRRENRSGFKAGNLNHFLQGRTDYDFFTVLDSDEIIPPDYIEKTLKYFCAFEKCGAVQARHKADGGKNVFQKLMQLSVASNGSTVQIIKNFYGANALIGHGMSVSRACFMRTNGFPLVVAEDISFAVDIKNAGFDIVYAPDILCTEEFPVDYVSLKKRQCKWTQGNLEYMRRYNHEIDDSDMRWFEQLDLKLSHYSLPIVPLLSFFLAFYTIVLGFLGYPVIRYSVIVYGVMIVFLCSPMIPDLFVYKRSKNFLLLLPYFVVNVITYASLSPMMLKTIFLNLCGKKAVFIVTPKQSRKFTFREILFYSRDSVIFALVMGTVCFLACRSILPVLFLTAGCACSPFVIALSNISVSSRRSPESSSAKND